MVQISIISGKDSGKTINLDKFPALVGRLSNASLVLKDDGVWDKHFEISYVPGDGFYLSAIEPAITVVNDKSVQKIRLRNGDVIVAGGAKLRFWLSEVKSKTYILREAITWISIISLFFIQVYIIYKLIQITG
jgi:pSer/pThr/pTyr-binding forkhead associated (FHA) protein